MDNRSVSESGKFQFFHIDNSVQLITIYDLLDKECAFINEKFMMALDDFLQAEKKRCYCLYMLYSLFVTVPKAGRGDGPRRAGGSRNSSFRPPTVCPGGLETFKQKIQSWILYFLLKGAESSI